MDEHKNFQTIIYSKTIQIKKVISSEESLLKVQRTCTCVLVPACETKTSEVTFGEDFYDSSMTHII